MSRRSSRARRLPGIARVVPEPPAGRPARGPHHDVRDGALDLLTRHGRVWASLLRARAEADRPVRLTQSQALDLAITLDRLTGVVS